MGWRILFARYHGFLGKTAKTVYVCTTHCFITQRICSLLPGMNTIKTLFSSSAVLKHVFLILSGDDCDQSDMNLVVNGRSCGMLHDLLLYKTL